MSIDLDRQLFVDFRLAAQLEQSEGRANRNFVEARKVTSPELGATWIEAAGAYALFDGVGSPLTQTFGLGMNGEVTSGDLDNIESFFNERNAAVYHEVSPLADIKLIEQLNNRCYQPMEFSNVLCRSIGKDDLRVPKQETTFKVRAITSEESEVWAQTSARGWSAYPEMMDFILSMGRNFVATDGAIAMQAELSGEPVATAVLCMIEGVAILAGASTIPEARCRGAQSALLAARLSMAAEQGCRLAMMCALPGSASQRNAQRNKFNVAYTRIKWHKAN